MRGLLLALAVLELYQPSRALASGDETNFVVQLHASGEGFVVPNRSDAGTWRTQRLTTASGQQFECYLPPLQASNESEWTQVAAIQETEEQEGGGLEFARAAVTRLQPKCVKHSTAAWSYDMCSGVLVRSWRLHGPKKAQQEEMTVQANSETKAATEVGVVQDDHQDEQVAEFQVDGMESLLEYNEPVNTIAQERLDFQQKPVYTQTFKVSGKSESSEPAGLTQEIKLQFLCSPMAFEDQVLAVKLTDSGELQAAVIASRVFCDPKDRTSNDEDLSVESLLQPLAESQVCIKRNEGWWTYEFCFGHDIRQYHRDSNGQVTLGFSLGSYDANANDHLDTTGEKLVSEYIDATRDILRPAFVEIYSEGTHCEEIGVSKPREAKVFFYCNPSSNNHHILSVKESRTCAYTIKIATPVVCDHPHFVQNDNSKRDNTEVLHCLPINANAATHKEEEDTVENGEQT